MGLREEPGLAQGGCQFRRLRQRRRRVRADDDAAAAEDERRHRRDAAAARLGGRVAQGGFACSGSEGGVHAGGVETGGGREVPDHRRVADVARLAEVGAEDRAVELLEMPGSSAWAQALAARARCVFASSESGVRGAKSIPSAAAWRRRFAIIAASSSGSYPRLESGSPAGGTSGWISKGRQVTSSAMRPAS